MESKVVIGTRVARMDGTILHSHARNADGTGGTWWHFAHEKHGKWLHEAHDSKTPAGFEALTPEDQDSYLDALEGIQTPGYAEYRQMQATRRAAKRAGQPAPVNVQAAVAEVLGQIALEEAFEKAGYARA